MPQPTGASRHRLLWPLPCIIKVTRSQVNRLIPRSLKTNIMNTHNTIFATRVFAIPDASNDQPEWYCLTREQVMGPYSDEQQAQNALDDFIRLCQALGWNGDRDATEDAIARQAESA